MVDSAKLAMEDEDVCYIRNTHLHAVEHHALLSALIWTMDHVFSGVVWEAVYCFPGPYSTSSAPEV